MLHLLFTVIFTEMAFIITLVFKNPLRKLVLMGLDRVKQGKGPVVLKTLAGTVFVVFLSSLYSFLKIKSRWMRITDDILNPTDQVLLAKHQLEATLLGCSLFLGLMIDRLHNYMRELRLRRKSMEAAKKQSQGFEDKKAEEMKALKQEMTTLKGKLVQLESELEAKTKEVNSSEANAIALRKQSEGFLLEYDRLLEENQNLRNQLQSLDKRISRSSSKKNT